MSSDCKSVQDHAEVRDATRALAEGLQRTIVGLDSWATDHPPQAQKHHVARSDLQLRDAQMERIREALQWGVSVGFYGESQAGKSNLVSRLAKSLGSKQSKDGGICVRGQAEELPIDFMDAIDPGGGGKESTGVVCRFTTTDVHSDGKVPLGGFPVSFISHAELICSLVDGFQTGVDKEHRPERTWVRQTLDELRRAPRERDGQDANGQPERSLMPQLLEAWSVLTEKYRSELIGQLDVGGDGEDGWDEFVRECVDRGERPKVGTLDQSDLRKLVSMLWGGDSAMGNLWFRLFSDLRKLEQMKHHWVGSQDLCKSERSGFKSLIDVSWLNELAGDGNQVNCAIQGHEGDREAKRALSKAAFVALVRELVLPVPVEADPATASCFDVIDFPGARAADKKKDHQSDEGAGRVLAVQALRRGKLNRLFITGVQHFDSSVLCLATQCGNQSAGEVIRRALKDWLQREGWPECAQRKHSPLARTTNSTGGGEGPPLVLAMTKVDMLAKEPNRLGDTFHEVKETISPVKELPWMDKWSPVGKFQGTYWVYNPLATLGRTPITPLHRLNVRQQFERAFDDSDLLRNYTWNVKANLDALLTESGDAVGLLAERLKGLALSAGDRRIPGLALHLLKQAGDLKGRMDQIHIGKVDGAAVGQANKQAKSHMDAIKGLDVSHAAGLLRCLTMSTKDVRKAWQRAMRTTGAGLAVAKGEVHFEVFFTALCGVFADEFERRSAQKHTLWKQEMERRHKAGFVAEFRQKMLMLPTAPWFKRPLRQRVEPLLRRVNAAQMSKERLANIVAAQWNRCMTWLDEEPPAGGDGCPNRPKLRGEQASNRGIVQHWSSALSRAYDNLVDPEDRKAPWNVDIGKCLDNLVHALATFRDRIGTQQGQHWDMVKSEIEAMLQDARPTGVAP